LRVIPDMKAKKHPCRFKRVWELYDAPVFDTDMGLGLPFLTTKRKLSTFVDDNWLYFFKGNMGAMHYCEIEMDLAKEYGYKDFMDRKYAEKYFSDSQRLLQKTRELIAQIDSTDISKISIEELHGLVKKGGLLLTDIFAYFNTCQPQCVAKLEEELRNYLKGKVSETQANEIYLKITSSEKQTSLNCEELEWLELVRYAQKKELKKSDISSIKTKDPDAYKKIQALVDKYSLLGTADGGPRWDEAHYLELLQHDIERKNVEKRIAEIKSYPALTKKEKEKIFKDIKPDTEHKYIADLLAEMGHNRIVLRLDGWMIWYYYFKNIIFKELSRRFAIPLGEIRAMRLDEILGFIRNSKIDRAELKKRADCFLMGMKDGKLELYSGKEAEDIKNARIKPMEYEKATELKGMIAVKGVAVGMAVVLKWGDKEMIKKMLKMGEGDILVAGQTRPQLMPAIRKSAAIVTDEGGITSHAAIVSRELGIPCVVGVHHGTDVIKDGDYVLVDATKGIVRKISKQEYLKAKGNKFSKLI